MQILLHLLDYFCTSVDRESSGSLCWREIQLTCVIIRGKDWELAAHNRSLGRWLTLAFIQPQHERNDQVKKPRSSNLFCVINCPKKYLCYHEMVFSEWYKVALLSADRFWEEGVLWLAESVWVEGRAVSHYSFCLEEEEASGWWWKQSHVVLETVPFSDYFSLYHPSFRVKCLALL